MLLGLTINKDSSIRNKLVPVIFPARQCLPRLVFSLTLALFTFTLLPDGTFGAPASPVYKNPNAPLEARVNDLLNRLTQKEKLSMLSGTGFTSQPLPRFGLRPMQFADAGQGVRGGGGTPDGIDPVGGPATAFPAGVSMASSWDSELIREIGTAIGDEAKNKGIGVQIELGPAVNIHRSPLCGRDSEYLSEDPYLNARLAVQYIEGMQSTGVGSCIKHYACNNEEVDRGSVNVIVDERTLREIYLPAFEAAVKEAHVRAFMAAYNKVNGPYCTANWFLLTNVLRHDWGFDGLVMSDWGAVHETSGVVNGGTDLEMPGPGYLVAANLKKSLSNGSISQPAIDHAVKDILRATIRAGLADPVQYVPNHSEVGSAAHQALVLRAGQEGMILLKNDGGLLPLNPNTPQTIAIIGPRAKNWQYNSRGSTGLSPTVQVNAFEGITQRLASNTGAKLLYEPADDYTGKPIPLEDLTTPDGSEHGLSGTYFTSQNLSGTPLLTRTDPSVDFNFTDATRPTGLQAEHFSIRWTGIITAPMTGSYIFNVRVDDGCRLWIGDTLVVDQWQNGAARSASGSIDLAAGKVYPIKLEYYQDRGDALVSLSWLTPDDNSLPFAGAAAVAKQADIAIVMVGSEPEVEGNDRTSMDLPSLQDSLIKTVAAANPHTIVVLDNGGPVLVNSWIDGVPAVLEAGFSGELGGTALASVLFGDVSPSGKLVDTYGVRREDYPDYGHFPGINNVVHYTEGIYVGYRAFDKRRITPEFPFGYGLSYTTFSYSNIKLEKPTWSPSSTFTVTANITNTGKVRGAEVAELYIEPKSPRVDRPIRELKGFARVDLLPGQTKTAQFVLVPRDFAYCDVAGKQWRADEGKYIVEIGASSRDLKLESPVTLTKTWTDPIPGVGARDPFAPKPSLSTGKHSTASSIMHGNISSYAFDGDTSTRWESVWSDPQWIEVDLKKPTTFSKVGLSWETAFSSNYQLQVSNDNKSWRTVYSTTTGMGGLDNFRFAPVTARYVRLFLIKRGTQFGDSLYSFDLYAK
jgi:beta-glucosidase